MPQLAFDEETAKKLEAAYRTRDVIRRRRLVREAVAAAPGERILDIGCGLGFYLTELAAEVGPEGSVAGLDRSEPMLAYAEQKAVDVPNVSLAVGEATDLPFDDASFDAAISVQVLEYVAELDTALAELHRVVRPGGRIVLWDVDWTALAWHSEDPARMRDALASWDAHLAHPALPRTLAPSLRRAGFGEVEVSGHAFTTSSLDPESYAALVMPLVEEFVAGHEAFGPERAAAWADEQRDLDARGEFFFSVVQYRFSASRPG
jgi:arsenite methyltransferase